MTKIDWLWSRAQNTFIAKRRCLVIFSTAGEYALKSQLLIPRYRVITTYQNLVSRDVRYGITRGLQKLSIANLIASIYVIAVPVMTPQSYAQVVYFKQKRIDTQNSSL